MKAYPVSSGSAFTDRTARPNPWPMITYDPDQPLVFIHVPKTAGTSVRRIFKDWFGDGLIEHYHRGAVPDVIDLNERHSRTAPVCLYGHFNRERGFGLEGRYDGQRQFVTILRDPLEKVLSAYFYVQRRATEKSASGEPLSMIEQQTLDMRVSEYLRETRHSYLKHFPVPVTENNYKAVIEDYFIAIGITEELERSMHWIAACLGRPEPIIPRLNVTPRNNGYAQVDISEEDRAIFAQNHALEFAVYEYCRRRLREITMDG